MTSRDLEASTLILTLNLLFLHNKQLLILFAQIDEIRYEIFLEFGKSIRSL